MDARSARGRFLSVVGSPDHQQQPKASSGGAAREGAGLWIDEARRSLTTDLPRVALSSVECPRWAFQAASCLSGVPRVEKWSPPPLLRRAISAPPDSGYGCRCRGGLRRTRQLATFSLTSRRRAAESSSSGFSQAVENVPVLLEALLQSFLEVPSTAASGDVLLERLSDHVG